jgi:hypothetical protein
MTRSAKVSATRLFTSIDQKRVAESWFSTCTVPSAESMSVAEFKRVLLRYFATVQRAWGERLAWYWAIEPTEAGTLHLHAILMWVGAPPSLVRFREWNDLAWSTSTRCKHPSHRKTACNVQRARSWAGVRSYLSGYLAPSKWSHWTGGETGRVHGVRNRHLLPITPVDHELTPAAMAILRRAVAKLRSRRASGMWTVDRETGKRIQRWSLPACPRVARALVKHFASVAHRSLSMKIIRRRARFWRSEVAWDQETVIVNGRESRPRVVPHVVDEFGRGVRSWSRGPSELHIRDSQAQRLIEWAIREDLRRQHEQRRFDELGVPF